MKNQGAAGERPSPEKALVYDPDLGSGGGSEFVSTAIASALSGKYEVTLAGASAEGLDARTLEERYSIPLGELPVIRLGPADAEIHERVRAVDLFAVTHATWIPPLARRNILYCHFPLATRWRKLWGIPLPFSMRSFFAHRFDAVLCLSHFTQSWIRRRWKMPSDIAYPYVPDFPLGEGGRKNQILSLGRFDPVKRQKEIVGYFRKLLERGVQGWELVLAGFPTEPAYVEEVRSLARDLPIRFELSVSSERKVELLRGSKILWNLRGLDSDDFPVGIEHFGIPVVEAMRLGTVPVAYGVGGPSEIIRVSGEEGVLIRSEEELIDRTADLIARPESLQAISGKARERSRFFSKEAFDRVILRAASGENR